MKALLFSKVLVSTSNTSLNTQYQVCYAFSITNLIYNSGKIVTQKCEIFSWFLQNRPINIQVKIIILTFSFIS